LPFCGHAIYLGSHHVALGDLYLVQFYGARPVSVHSVRRLRPFGRALRHSLGDVGEGRGRAWKFWHILRLGYTNSYIARNKILDFARNLFVVIVVVIPHCHTRRHLLCHCQQARPEWCPQVFSYLGLAIPNFLFALIIVVAWAVFFGNTPTGLLSREYQGVPWSYAKFVNLLSHAWIPVIVLGWSATAIALQTVRALISDEYSKLYVTAARGRGLYGQRLLWRYPARHALGPLVNSLGFDLNRIFNELPIVALILSLTDAGALLLQSLVRSHDQYLASAILLLLTASIIGLNFITGILLAMFDPRFRRGLLGSV